MRLEDVEMVRAVRRELARRCLDAGQTQVTAIHGVIHLYGRVRPMRGHEHEFEEEILALHKTLKLRPGVRDVIIEWDTGGHGTGLPKRLH